MRRRLGRHHRDGDDDERDWRERKGRYAGLDRDTDDRPQVKPVPRPDDPALLTHRWRDPGVREPEADAAGPWREHDDGD
jgi:hypothetical protein